jgi:hypothetical protein
VDLRKYYKYHIFYWWRYIVYFHWWTPGVLYCGKQRQKQEKLTAQKKRSAFAATPSM